MFKERGAAGKAGERIVLGDVETKLFRLLAHGLRRDLGCDVGGHRNDAHHRVVLVAHRSDQAEVVLVVDDCSRGGFDAGKRCVEGPECGSVSGEFGHMPAEEVRGPVPDAGHATGDICEAQVSVKRGEGHRQGRNRAVDQGLTAALRVLSRSMLTLVLEVNQELDGLGVFIANNGYRCQSRQDGPIAALQEALRRVPVGETVGHTFEDVAGRTLAGGKDQGNVTANQLIDTEADHGAEGFVDDVDAKRGEVDNQLSERAPFEHRLVETQPLVKSGGVRRQPGGGHGSGAAARRHRDARWATSRLPCKQRRSLPR